MDSFPRFRARSLEQYLHESTSRLPYSSVSSSILFSLPLLESAKLKTPVCTDALRFSRKRSLKRARSKIVGCVETSKRLSFVSLTLLCNSLDELSNQESGSSGQLPMTPRMVSFSSPFVSFQLFSDLEYSVLLIDDTDSVLSEKTKAESASIATETEKKPFPSPAVNIAREASLISLP